MSAARPGRLAWPFGLCLGLLLGCGADASTLSASDVWSRPTVAAGAEPDLSLPGVVYLSLRNGGDTHERLTGAHSTVCARVELHRTRRVDGRSRMQAVPEGALVPAGGQLELAPGGLHLMLIGLRRGLRPGDSLPLTLAFASGATLELAATVRPP